MFRGTESLCVFGGFEKIGDVKEEGVQSGCRTKDLIT